jgi:AraC-like DNA-binding protein
LTTAIFHFMTVFAIGIAERTWLTGSSMTVLVRAAALSNYGDVAREVGLDPNRMLRRVQLDPAVLKKPDTRIPAASVVRLLETSAEQSGCTDFGLRMAESRRLSDFGAISLLMKHQRTLRDILAIIARYRQLLNEALAMHVEEAKDLVIIREELVGDGNLASRQSYELAVGTVFRMFRALLGDRWQPYSVHFTHTTPPDTSVHRRVFGFNVSFDSDFNGIVCAAADLDQPNPEADPVMAAYARQFLDTLPKAEFGSATLDVRKAIYLLLPLGKASIEQIAGSLGLNVRTLQRRLDAEKTRFSDLVNDVRRDLVVRYLSNKNYSMLQVAEMLGYTQLSSFTRWFVLEFGAPPTRWRAEHGRAKLAR